jgi:hypothetical protein
VVVKNVIIPLHNNHFKEGKLFVGCTFCNVGARKISYFSVLLGGLKEDNSKILLSLV